MATLTSKFVKEWHPTKNGDLKSYDVKSKSNKKAWWRCEKGHEWEAIIANRTDKRRGCPYCSGRRAIKGETDLPTVNPKLAKEWHPTKNGNLKPYEVTAQSHKKVWWCCEKGHEWHAYIYSRIKKGCPYCSGQRAIKGETDLVTINPILAKEWHPTKNGELKPDDFTSQSHKKVWWRCEKGHEWERSVHGRANNSGCPYCSGRNAIKGKTDLATVNPILAHEWHATKNGELKPEDVTVNSHKRVWWHCGKGHDWNASIASRNINGCPFCSGHRVKIGETDLATVNPILAKEWHSTKNGTLTPDAVTAKSNKKVWWICSEKHEWRTVINTRANGTGCPECRRNNLNLSY